MKKINGIEIYETKDLEAVCRKCQQAYYGDFIAQDCGYCPLPHLIEQNRMLAERIAEYE